METKTNLKEKNPKHSKIWRLNSMLLNNEWVKNEIREEIKNFLETNENELATTQNLRDTAKAVLRGKFIVIQAYLKRIETAQINNLTLHLQELEEQQQRQPRASRRKAITKIRAELNDIYRTFHPKEAKIHILFKCTWNIFKDRPHDRTQNKPQQIQEN